MKKKILYLLVIFLITGCSTEYNLEFKNGKFEDSISVGKFQLSDFPDYEYFEPIASYRNYNIKYYDFEYKDGYLNLNHNYSYDEYRISEAFTNCFELSGITYDDDYYYILTSGEFKCLSYQGYKNDKVTVNFSTDLEVESSNADSIIDNKYTWIFNDENYKDKTINIKLIRNSNTSTEVTRKKSIFDNITVSYFIIVISITIILYFGYKKFKKYSNSKNKLPD